MKMHDVAVVESSVDVDSAGCFLLPVVVSVLAAGSVVDSMFVVVTVVLLLQPLPLRLVAVVRN